MTTPAFAVVGHPNKGKSSLVATLTQQDAVRISPVPGTTTRADRYDLRVDNQTLYTLIDTPGFQRARAALDWMKQHETDAASRPGVVARFVEEHTRGERFHDEVELLRPIVEGAAILYVVDGAHPYGPEYDAEMEVLRWTGRPSLAVINPIGEARFADQWRDALGQFFRIVRVLDAVHAPLDQRVELLRAFGQLDESWKPNLDAAADALVRDRAQRLRLSAEAIAQMLVDALTLTVERKLAKDEDPTPHKAKLEEKYAGQLRQLERQCREAVEAVFEHHGLDRSEPEFDALDRDLLHEDTWLLFGLKKRDLIAAGAATGAVAGGVIDASLLGSSFLAGTVIGGIVGGTAGYLSAGRLTQTKVLHQPLGGRLLRCGPAKDANVPFVLLGRARLHATLIAQRTHAQRDTLVLGDAAEKAGGLNPLTAAQKRSFATLFAKARKTEPGDAARGTVLRELADELEDLLV